MTTYTTLLINMTAQSRNPYVTRVSSEPERILWNLREATDDSTPISDAEFSAQFARACCVCDKWCDEIDVLSERSVNDYVEEELHKRGIVEEERIPGDKSSNEPGFSRPTLDDVRHLNGEALL